MGIFGDIMKGAKEALNEFSNAINDEDKNRIKITGNSNYDNPHEVLPSRVLEKEDVLNNRKISIRISEDFVEQPGYTNSIASFKYNPPRFYTDYDIDIDFLAGPGECMEVAEVLDEYIETGTVSDTDMFEEINDDRFLFKAQIQECGHNSYFYVLKKQSESMDEYDIFLLCYSDELMKTELEKKLKACFEEAVQSFTQTSLN